MRSKAKMVNYGIVYGLSAYGLADRLQIAQDEAQEFIDRYLERFPAVAQFMKDAVEQAEQHGYVSTLFGRRRQIPEMRARNWQTRKLGERLAVNTIIQGTAADIIKVAMVRCARRAAPPPAWRRALILQIHDELLFEGPEEEMEQADRDRHARDGRRRRARPAAGGGRRRRAELAGREVAASRRRAKRSAGSASSTSIPSPSNERWPGDAVRLGQRGLVGPGAVLQLADVPVGRLALVRAARALLGGGEQAGDDVGAGDVDARCEAGLEQQLRALRAGRSPRRSA